MKNEYRTPEMEVTRFETENIITDDSTEPIFPDDALSQNSRYW